MASGSALLQSMMWMKKILEELGVRKAAGDGRDPRAVEVKWIPTEQVADILTKTLRGKVSTSSEMRS